MIKNELRLRNSSIYIHSCNGYSSWNGVNENDVEEEIIDRWNLLIRMIDEKQKHILIID